jgi:drug/metabolite transporter (DMT)-like permease
MTAHGPAFRGTLLALASALAFGVTTPLVQRLVRAGGAGAGPFATAMLLYGGAALVGLVSRSRREAPLRSAHGARLVAVAVAGALVAPALLTWGLLHTSGTSAALMLNLEAVFTVALARVVYREHVGGRVALAAVLLLAGGALLLLDRARGPSSGSIEVAGLVAVATAALFWALDNVLARPLSALDPSAVVAAKSGLGATLSLAAALALRAAGAVGERWPSPLASAGLVVVGGVGYGVSLRLYLRAQREIGAGRTASVFASGPFWGAALAWLLGEPAGALTIFSALAMGVGLALHLTESHGHPHVHEALEHEHSHVHDDGHHDHHHDPMPVGPHTHLHRHARLVHDHAHLPDLHHDHEHTEAPPRVEAATPRASDAARPR